METLTISRIQNGQPVKGYSYEMTYGNRAKSDVTPDSIKASELVWTLWSKR